MYNGTLKRILDSEQDLNDYSGIAEMPYRRIYDEASLESFLDIWNWRVVSEALATAQKGASMAADGSHIFMARGGQAVSPKLPVIKESTNRRLRPDWAGIKQSSGCPKQSLHILPRDKKDGQQMEEQHMDISSLTRSPKDKADSSAHRNDISEYKAITWSYHETETQSSDGRLTVNLALWWFHMMAAVGHEMQEYDKALDEAHDRKLETPSDDE
ncbi:MAG: hypothetical protein LQ349_005456 [Xanthoria aureola]|nr:MAG: hypothetical protein LQ349_005456 [Xanthoria aureola]